jgi:drug/metabolite transporter (DMT)-like permease
VLTYALAVLAAGANAISSVLQRKANKRVPQRENLSLRQIWILLHQPVWFGGIVAITAGFLLQASALGSGQLAVVEPVLVLELPFTLILASRLFRQRLGPREWLPAFAMTAGLAGLVYLLAPSAGGSPRVHWYGWLAGIGGNLALVGVLVLWARRGSIRRSRGKDTAQPGGSFRAAVLSVAAGSTFGLTAALMKAMTGTVAGGFGHLFTDWPLYTMVAAGVLGFFLTQAAMNAGQLIAAQPGLTLSDPLISVLWGVLAFHEAVRQGWYILGEVACAGVIVAGVVMLARSSLLAEDRPSGGEQSARAEGQEGHRRRVPDWIRPGGEAGGVQRPGKALARAKVTVQVRHHRDQGVVVELDDAGDDSRRAHRQQAADQAE